MNKIKAIIFDLDGTIANTLPLCIEAFRQSVEPLTNKPISDHEIIATFGPSEEGTIMALAPDHYEQGLASYLSHYEDLHDMCLEPFEGIIDLLTLLKNKGIRIAMVTGKGKLSTEISLRKFGIKHFFEMIETGHQYGPRKPDGIQAVIDYLKPLDKTEMIYVGDVPSDITASHSVGIPIVAAAWASTTNPDKLLELKPDFLFHTIQDFTTWLQHNI
ncbi:Pyrophosphatase PpaX [Poriferisphaera corsica]|uniref:phosphoglycolate phosphatase n=1 Tax=Poriferisphaera corsica TaxID=2528020 RepID=A0A517YV13_9BACT|nr:HAD family hydrolase [Poriferisphaera corsica]QDU33992.1 Pyrophosphatase PpaX [Poriferisphaera corsica]